MKKFLYVAFIAIVGISLVSCEKEQKKFYLSDLQGEWVEDGTTHHVRFTSEAADEEEFFWGCEWGVDDINEEDLIFHGNGWFKYRLNKKDLLEIHMMDYGWADIPKEYVMVKLTSSKMTYYPKNFKDEKKHFTKQ